MDVFGLKNKMIITQLTGGLGNQMFIYAMGKAVANRLGVEFKIDTTIYKEHKKRKYQLNNFNISAKEASVFEIAIRKYNPFRKIVKDEKYEFIPSALELPDNSYIDSFIHNYWHVWQSEKYFTEIEDIVRKEFTLKEPLPKNTDKLIESTKTTNSVSVHIRRTDYKEPKQQAIFKLCTPEYYSDAISYISKKVGNPKFFVFSDDLEWSKTLPFPKDTIFIGPEFGLQDFQELIVMSKRKHNIIANSSFSWWAAWLNENPRKIVITPKKWFVKPDINEKDLIPEKWIKL